jgi:hypothetical protein
MPASANPPASGPPEAAGERARSAEDWALFGCLGLILITVLPLFLVLLGGSLAQVPILLGLLLGGFVLLKLAFRLFRVEHAVAEDRARMRASGDDPRA